MTVPGGYVMLRRGRVRAAVREDLRETLERWLLSSPFAPPPGSARVPGGRGGAWRLALPDGRHAVLRRYLRGGMLARVVHETYVGLLARPFRELAVTVEARRRGVPAPEVLAARVEGRVVYHGAILTAEIPGSVTLLEALREAGDGTRRRALAAGAGRVVAAMHRAGIWHADLNLTNLLASAGNGEVSIVDFDRARVARAPLATRARRGNLARLARSLRKLDPEGRLAAPDDIAAFHAAYATVVEAPCAS